MLYMLKSKVVEDRGEQSASSKMRGKLSCRKMTSAGPVSVEEPSEYRLLREALQMGHLFPFQGCLSEGSRDSWEKIILK